MDFEILRSGSASAVTVSVTVISVIPPPPITAVLVISPPARGGARLFTRTA